MWAFASCCGLRGGSRKDAARNEVGGPLDAPHSGGRRRAHAVLLSNSLRGRLSVHRCSTRTTCPCESGFQLPSESDVMTLTSLEADDCLLGSTRRKSACPRRQ